MATPVNLDNQEYFLKLAPDLSVFELAERYFYDQDFPEGVFGDVFLYRSNSGSSLQTTFRRAMFKVYSLGNLTVRGMSDDEYCVIPYASGVQIVVVHSDSEIVLDCGSGAMELVLGVAF
jgi:hypothetical protein